MRQNPLTQGISATYVDEVCGTKHGPMTVLKSLISINAVSLDVVADDWRAAGALLVEVGTTAPAYTEAIIVTVDTHGPYAVITPGFTLPHARPDESALRTGLSFARLAAPVEFGAGDNDPVTIVMTLAAADSEQHREALTALSGFTGCQDVDVEGVHHRPGRWELLAGGALKPGGTVNGLHLAPLAPAMVALSKPDPEDLPKMERDHVQQTHWPYGHQVDDHGTYLSPSLVRRYTCSVTSSTYTPPKRSGPG